MHHTLKLYEENQKFTLRLYMFFGACTRIPLLGRLVRWIANVYGTNMHRAHLLTPGEANELLELADGIVKGPCTCRQLYHKCDHPRDNEILLGPTRHTLLEAKPRESQEIGKEEAREILKDSHERGLIFTILKCRGDFYAICSCCTCCCVPLRLSKQYGIGNVLVRHKDIVKEFREYQLAHLAEELT